MTRTNTAPLKTARWAEVRAMVAHRASFRCECCNVFLGMTGQADHVIPRRDIPLLGIGVFDPSNLQYLCTSCHSEKSKGASTVFFAAGEGHALMPTWGGVEVIIDPYSESKTGKVAITTFAFLDLLFQRTATHFFKLTAVQDRA